jgi:3-methylcrotonyl-CoA carboxylase alpha subunit
MFEKVLIANRGEIACRVMRTCRRLAIRTVAVHSSADARALHVEMADEAYLIGGPRPVESYLRGEAILEAARASGAQAIHPGYGFLSENAAFARAVEAAGRVFIGPTPDAIERMGLKDRAKAIMEAAGVPVVPGYHGERQEPAFLRAEAKRIGYPLLIKAVAGGGGKGMRLAASDAEFEAALDGAQREAKSAFGNAAVLLERFVTEPHHIELQVFGDTHGNFVHLFERECSIQRRHQKVLEETPSPFVDAAMRARMGEAAVAAARAIGYRGAGTIEFIAGADRRFFFMEMNTRLQVEHPVTEMTTGEDLVEWQLRVAAGQPLPLVQDEIHAAGHAIEVRLCAENPARQFLPETGRIEALRIPAACDEVRLDTGVREGDAIGVHYDPMFAKLVAWGDDRLEAARRLLAALGEMAVVGVTTNLAFLERVVAHPAFLGGNTDTGFIERHRADLLPPPGGASDETLAACVARIAADDARATAAAPHSPWNDTQGWRLNLPASRRMEFGGPDGTVTAVALERHGGRAVLAIGERRRELRWSSAGEERIEVSLDGASFIAHVVRIGPALSVRTPYGRFELHLVDPLRHEPVDHAPDARLTALMPGRVVKVMAAAGDKVKKGQALMILEAMKMEHTVASPRDGVIERVAFRADDLVPADAVLFAFRD